MSVCEAVKGLKLYNKSHYEQLSDGFSYEYYEFPCNHNLITEMLRPREQVSDVLLGYFYELPQIHTPDA